MRVLIALEAIYSFASRSFKTSNGRVENIAWDVLEAGNVLQSFFIALSDMFGRT